VLVSVVIPAFNEQRAIGPHVRAVLAYGDARSFAVEVLVVDDGSSDGTAASVEALAEEDPRVRLVRMGRNVGKGRAVREGLLAAEGDVRGFTDADAATDISELDRILPALESGAAVAIGSRALKDEGTEVKADLHRVVIGRTFNTLLRLIAGTVDQGGRPIADTQCGFKWFTREAAEAIFARTVADGFAFDVEALYLANRLDFPVAEVPVNWTEQGESRVNLLVDPAKMLISVLGVPLRHHGVGR